MEEWTFAYGPHGLEFARKFVNEEEVLTQDFTTDTDGTILSMTYTEDDAQEGVNGEYYFHYDNFGNTVLLTDEDGIPQYTALYDISDGKRVQEWNPNNLSFAFKGEGKEEKISFGISDIQISIFYDLVVRKKITIAITGKRIVTDLTAKGGTTLKTCGNPCPAGQILLCNCCWKGTSKVTNKDSTSCSLYYYGCPEGDTRSIKTKRETIILVFDEKSSFCYCIDENMKPI